MTRLTRNRRLAAGLLAPLLALSACASGTAVKDMTRRTSDHVDGFKKGLIRFAKDADEKELRIAEAIAEERIYNANNDEELVGFDLVLKLVSDKNDPRLKAYTTLQQWNDRLTSVGRIQIAEVADLAEEQTDGLEKTPAPRAELEAVGKKLSALLKRGDLSAFFDYLKAVAGEIRAVEKKES